MKPPEQSPAGRTFNERIEAKTYQGDASGKQAGANGDDPFEEIPDDGEVFEKLPAAQRIST